MRTSWVFPTFLLDVRCEPGGTVAPRQCHQMGCACAASLLLSVSGSTQCSEHSASAMPCLTSWTREMSLPSPTGSETAIKARTLHRPLGSQEGDFCGKAIPRLLLVQALLTRFERGKEEQEGWAINHVKHTRPLCHLYFCDAACMV